MQKTFDTKDVNINTYLIPEGIYKARIDIQKPTGSLLSNAEFYNSQYDTQYVGMTHSGYYCVNIVLTLFDSNGKKVNKGTVGDFLLLDSQKLSSKEVKEEEIKNIKKCVGFNLIKLKRYAMSIHNISSADQNTIEMVNISKLVGNYCVVEIGIKKQYNSDEEENFVKKILINKDVSYQAYHQMKVREEDNVQNDVKVEEKKQDVTDGTEDVTDGTDFNFSHELDAKNDNNNTGGIPW